MNLFFVCCVENGCEIGFYRRLNITIGKNQRRKQLYRSLWSGKLSDHAKINGMFLLVSADIRNATSGTFCTVVKSKIAHKAYNKDV